MPGQDEDIQNKLSDLELIQKANRFFEELSDRKKVERLLKMQQELTALNSKKDLVKPVDEEKVSKVEKDPAGLNAHTPGAKLDEGKLLTGLVLGDFANALEEVSKVGTFGAKKYSESGWLEVENAPKRYHNALHRHLLANDKGELFDSDSGLQHLSHLAWNVLALLELRARNGLKS